jgi:hypothetical protein
MVVASLAGDACVRMVQKEVGMHLKHINSIVFWSELGVLAFLGGLVIWFVTPYGAGIYYDSLEYVAAAKNLAAGLGLIRMTCNSIEPMTRYPPFYSLTLSIIGFLGSDPVRGARFLDIVCMVGSIVMTGLITLKITNNRFFSLLAAFIMSVSPVVIQSYSWIMSEPLYIFLMLTCIYLFERYLETNSLKFLVSAAIVASLAVVTRFIGVALITSCILVLLVQLKNKKFLDKKPYTPVGIFSLISLFPLALWLLRSRILSGSATNRTLGWYISSPDRIVPLAYMAKWFVPWEGNLTWNWKAMAILAILFISFAVLCIGLIRLVRNSSLLTTLILNIVIYLGLVLLLMAIADPLTPLDNRLLLPVHVLTGILIISGISYIWGLSHWAYKAVAVLMIMYMVTFQSHQSIAIINNLRVDGQFYASSDWRNSEVSEILLKMGPKTVYTNDMTAVYFGANQPSCIIPLSNNQGDLERFIAAIRDNPQAVIAIYNRTMSGFVAPDLFNEGLNETILSDGVIYTH